MASPSIKGRLTQDDTPIWDIMSPEEDKAVMEKFAAESNKIVNRWFFGGASFAEKDAAVAFLVQLGAVQISIQSDSRQKTSQKHVSILFGDEEDLKMAQECSEDAIQSDGNSPATLLLDQVPQKNGEAKMNYDDVDAEDRKHLVWMTKPDDEDDYDNQLPDPAPVVEDRSTTQPRKEHPCPDCHTVLHSLWELDLHKLYTCSCRRTKISQKYVYNCDQCSNSFARQVCAVTHLRKVHNMSPTKAVEKLSDLKSTKRQERKREKSITSTKVLTRDKKKDVNDRRMTSEISKGTCEGSGHPRNEQRAKREKQSGTKIRIGKRILPYSDENIPQNIKRLCVKLQPLAKGGKRILESERVYVSSLTSNSQRNAPPRTNMVSHDGRAELIRNSDEQQKLNSNKEDGMSSSISEIESLNIKEEGVTTTSETLPADTIGINKYLCEKPTTDTEVVDSVDVRDHDVNVITNQKNKKCKFCDLQFKSKYQRNLHVLKIHTEDAPEYRCSTCDRSFLDKRIFRIHLKTHMDINEREKYSCPICEKSFLGKYDRQKHMKCHDERSETFKCDTCGKVLSSKRNLERHQNTKHVKKVLYICEVCGKNFYTTSCIKQHLETHMKEKTWECDECSFAFFRKSQLSAHKQRVHSTRQCFCTICGAAFKTKGTLKQHHRNVHTDDYNFSCDVCGKKFKSSSQLNVHVKIHKMDPKDKPFQCEICDGFFGSRPKLQVHMNWHNNVQSHSCQECGKSFLTKDSLDKHQYTHIDKETS